MLCSPANLTFTVVARAGSKVTGLFTSHRGAGCGWVGGQRGVLVSAVEGKPSVAQEDIGFRVVFSKRNEKAIEYYPSDIHG
ncbi:hypothetical protein HNY73_000157 [Argiope bruennichi]|uniref:Uncharacterized protein n=1 Tax=Argiope bruennichi TaxID=94029 RepID=A0A8T0G1J1_ARGBR|nr:hypothetical protein HNY73_000157 [Argiope bruennichi]